MQKKLPLIRLSAINPFLLELRRRGADPEALLRELGLPQDIPASSDLFIAAKSIYLFVERSAEFANDPYFGFSIGNALDLRDWDPIAASVERAETVGQLLTLFTMNAVEHSSATKFFLRIEGERSTFGLERLTEPSIRPGQNDAFYMGLMTRLLRRAARDRWDFADVLFRVADPDCIPDPSRNYRVAEGDAYGVQISFPTLWLFDRFETSRFQARADRSGTHSVPYSLVDAVRSALQPHLHETDLTVGRAASICGYDRRRLSRELRIEGTTLSREIAKLRASKAGQELSNTNLRVSEIAQRVGFTDPTVFSRAFKNWTGKSPLEYRRTNRSPG